jgi:pimeloyl-ACP methyl ester carboxylesterase
MTVVPQSTASTDPIITGIGGNVQTYLWTWQGQSYSIAYETLGTGVPVLLLPAFSTVSTRSEMRGLAERLAPQFQVVALDWLGFGQSVRSDLNYQPAMYHQLLQDFVPAVFDQPVVLVAAGHAAGYAVHFATSQPDRCLKLVLLAPTWRGPLPTMGAKPAIANGVRQMVRSPLLGQLLYKLNTLPSFLKWMYRRHVYVDATQLTPDFIDRKYRITQQPGARFAPAAFVTGGLDPVQTRSEFLEELRSVSLPVMIVMAEQAPPGSKAEMAAMAALPGLQVERLPGTLGLHEEYAEEVAELLRHFL